MGTFSDQVKLGISAINWVNEDRHEIGDHFTFEDLMSDFTKLGFTGTEMCRKFPQDADALLRALAAHGIQLTSWWKSVRFADPSLRDRELADYRKHAQFLQRLGAKHISTCEIGGSPHADPGVSELKPLDEEGWHHLVEGLNQAGAIAKEYGLKLVYHYHAGTVVEQPQEIAKLMEMTDPQYVYMLFDTGHAYFGGGNPMQLLRQYGERIAYVHLKDVRADILAKVKKEKWPFLKAVLQGVFTVPGDGCLDFDGILKGLADQEYKGWMILEAEQDPEKANPYEYAKRSKEYLDGIIGQL